MKYTNKEISLCKQVAEKYKKERLELGDWYLLKLLHEKEQVRLYGNQRPWIILTKDFIPLWTISDCLEFLIRKGFKFNDLISREKEWKIWFSKKMTDVGYLVNGKTTLEACLKAVLAVLEEE